MRAWSRFLLGAGSTWLALLLVAPAAEAQKPPKKDPPKKDAPKPAPAKPAEPTLAPFLGRLEEAKTLAKERNVPLLVHIVLEGEQANDEYRDKVLPAKDLVAASAGAVVIVANNGTHSKKVVDEPQPDGTVVRKELCSVYGTPGCNAHQRCWGDLFRDYSEETGGERTMNCPQTIVLAPDGEVALRVNNGNPPPPEDVVAALKETQLKAGPGLTDAELADVKRLLAEGETLMETKGWPDAVRTWQKVLAIAPKGRWAEQASQSLPIATKELGAEIERVAALLVPGTAAQGYERMLDLAKACAGLAPFEKDLAARLKKVETDKATRDEIAAWKLEGEAAAILAEAQKAADEGDEKKAQRVVRKLFTKRFASTAAHATARKLWPDVAAEEDAKQPPK